MINWRVTMADQRLIEQIAARAVHMAEHAGFEFTQQEFAMDITATHCNGCRLDLQRLLDADEFNFAHDIFGIQIHIDRKTGKLGGHFLPRYARRLADVAPLATKAAATETEPSVPNKEGGEQL
jgi:hypothetical protein